VSLTDPTFSPRSPRLSPLHDAAEVGDVELILKLLSKEGNDGDFNPVRLTDRLFFPSPFF
jgi:hypothetical protein